MEELTKSDWKRMVKMQAAIMGLKAIRMPGRGIIRFVHADRPFHSGIISSETSSWEGAFRYLLVRADERANRVMERGLDGH